MEKLSDIFIWNSKNTEKTQDFFENTQEFWWKTQEILKKLKNFEEKLKKSWKYSIFGKSIYPGCLNYGEKKACSSHNP